MICDHAARIATNPGESEVKFARVRLATVRLLIVYSVALTNGVPVPGYDPYRCWGLRFCYGDKY